MLSHPYNLWDLQRQAWGAKSKAVPNKGEQNQKWMPQPCLLGNPKECRNVTSTPISRGSATKGNQIRSGCLTLAFSGAERRSETRRHICILGDPRCQARGAKLEVVPDKGEQNCKGPAHHGLLRGPKRGWKCYVTSTFSRISNAKRQQNHKRSPTKGNKIKSGYISPPHPTPIPPRAPAKGGVSQLSDG